MTMIKRRSKIYIAGHRGMVGSALIRLLKSKGFDHLLFRTSQEMDLRDQAAVNRFMAREKPEYVFLLAARVGGIKANREKPAQFLYDNLMIEANVIHASAENNVKKLMYLGSSCMYPRRCPQPMKETSLLTGSLEPTNEAYAVAKIAGLKLCTYYDEQRRTNFMTLVSANLYGPGDHFNTDASHVIPALIVKCLEAKNQGIASLEAWGSGKVRREFLYVDDLVGAMWHFFSRYDAKDLPPFVNIGTGEDISIRGLAAMIKKETGYKGEILWNTQLPDGIPLKRLDIRLARKLGWRPRTDLKAGIRRTITGYKKILSNAGVIR